MRRISSNARGGSLVSAWRKRRISPLARAAPALSRAARPRGAGGSTPRGAASSLVRSVDPPSETIASASRGRDRRVATIEASSLIVGMTTEIFTSSGPTGKGPACRDRGVSSFQDLLPQRLREGGEGWSVPRQHDPMGLRRRRRELSFRQAAPPRNDGRRRARNRRRASFRARRDLPESWTSARALAGAVPAPDTPEGTREGRRPARDEARFSRSTRKKTLRAAMRPAALVLVTNVAVRADYCTATNPGPDVGTGVSQRGGAGAGSSARRRACIFRPAATSRWTTISVGGRTTRAGDRTRFRLFSPTRSASRNRRGAGTTNGIPPSDLHVGIYGPGSRVEGRTEIGSAEALRSRNTD